MPLAFSRAIISLPEVDLVAKDVRPQSLANLVWALATWRGEGGHPDLLKEIHEALECLVKAIMKQVWGVKSGVGWGLGWGVGCGIIQLLGL